MTKTEDILVSVVVPVYNVAPFLSRCIDSLRDQTWKNLEIILVDDGSTDGSAIVCDDYASKDSRIRVFHKKNEGVSRARNLGIEKSTGELVAFVDSDDFVSVEYIKILASNLIEAKADISVCGVQWVHRDGRTEDKFNTGQRLLMKADAVVEGFFEEGVIKDFFYSPCLKIFRRDILKSIFFDEKYSMGEDLLFVFNCLCHSSTIFLEDRCLYYYIRRENSAMTSAFSDKRMDYVKAAESVTDLCRKHFPRLENDAEFWLLSHKLVTCRQLILNPKYQKKWNAEFKNMKKQLLEKRSELFGRLCFMRKLDYILVCYFPFGYQILKKMHRLR